MHLKTILKNKKLKSVKEMKKAFAFSVISSHLVLRTVIHSHSTSLSYMAI
jgi:hypothetical protein